MANKDKLFSFRLSGALSEGLTWARTLFGGEVTAGEVARRLMEERLDQLRSYERERQIMLKERPRQTFLDILSKWRSGDVLVRAEWAFLAEFAHQAYESAYHRRDVVNRDFLVANFRAFGEVIRLRNTAIQVNSRIEDTYYLGNFGGRGSSDLLTRVEEVISELPKYPGVSWGSFGSRNLEVALRDEPLLDTVHLDIALRPYLSALLQLGLRGFWYNENSTVQDAKDEHLATDYSLRPIKGEKFSLSPLGGAHKIGAALDLDGVVPGLIAFNNFVELTEFAELLDKALSSEESSMVAKADGFALYRPNTWDKQQRFMLESGRFRLFFSTEDVVALKQLFDMAFEDPAMQGQLQRSAFAYGRI